MELQKINVNSTINQQNLELFTKYSLISSNIQNGRRRYVGRIMCGNEDVNVDISENYIGNKLNFTLNTMFGEEINTHIANLSATNIVEFLDKLRKILLETVGKRSKNLVSVYRKIIHEYSEFTAFHLTIKKSHISEDLSKINVTTVDEGGREHILEIMVNFSQSKDIFQPQNLDLPDKFAKDFCNNFSSLTEVYSKFLATVETLQPFFNVMDELDASCCVLDPDPPTRKDCCRRIWLEHNLSIIVIIDPANVRATPELKFLGPEKMVDNYLHRLSEKLVDWNENTTLLLELLNILELDTFPVKPSKEQEVLIDVGECSICFSLRFDNNLPDIICANKSCENFYHAHCLYEWLSSVNSKRIFNQLNGQCPNCEKGISCPIPEAADT